MAVSIGTNIFSLRAQRSLSSVSERLSTSFERLSSGLRINRVSDDAAGLAIAERLRSDSRIYTQAMRNVTDGLSFLNIADGALGELAKITTRQCELAEQSANGVYTYDQRKAMTAEANALVQEFNRIVQSTAFNGRRVLDAGDWNEQLRIQAGFGLEGGVAFSVSDALSRTTGTGSFGQSVSYACGLLAPTALSAADLDGDGALDLITAGYSAAAGGQGGAVSVRLSDGNGNFESASLYEVCGYSGSGIAAADLDGDGALDLITASYSQIVGPNIGVLFNRGDGTFGSSVSYTVESVSHAVFVTDINGDGAPDLVTAGETGDGIATVRLNDGHGTFGAAASYATESGLSRALFVTDINGDSAPDLVTAGEGGASGKATVRLNDGRGNFGAASYYSTESLWSFALSVTDINGDGAPDLVTAGQSATGGSVTIRLNDGRGNFGGAISYSAESSSSFDLAVADINGDGAADLVTVGSAGGSNNRATIRLNDGRGNFSAPVSYLAGGQQLFMADLSGDGVLDLLTGGASTDVEIRDALTRKVTTIASLDLFSRESAKAALSVLQAQLDRISSERAAVGSFQSRLAVALNTLRVGRENATAAGARITDIDIAQESAESVRSQILQQAAAAVLAQADRQPALALQLLNK